MGSELYSIISLLEERSALELITRRSEDVQVLSLLMSNIIFNCSPTSYHLGMEIYIRPLYSRALVGYGVKAKVTVLYQDESPRTFDDDVTLNSPLGA